VQEQDMAVKEGPRASLDINLMGINFVWIVLHIWNMMCKLAIKYT
jgi:hypothetical protein